MSYLRQLSGLFLGLTVKPEVINHAAADSSNTAENRIQFYIFPEQITSNIILADKEARRCGLPSLFEPVHVHDHVFDNRIICLTRSNSLMSNTDEESYSIKLEQLIQQTLASPELVIELIPVTLLWTRSPDKEDSLIKLFFDNSWETPTFFKQAVNISLHGRESYLQFHDRFNLSQFVHYFHDNTANHPYDISELTTLATLELQGLMDRQREVIIGPDLSDRRNVVHNILRSSSVKKLINDTATETGQTISEVQNTAAGYLEELVSDYSHATIRLLKRALSWLWTQLYDGVEVHNFDHVRQLAEDYELVYTPSHRSHIDYLLLSYIIYLRGMMTPYIAAGDNLNLPVLGSILRGGGAFFIRRTFKGNPLYAGVVREYLHSILSRNTPLEYFIEGGRSRTGRLLSPKTGMLAMTVHSQLRREGSKPIAFIPTYFGYERLMEGSTYVGEMSGKPKQSESIFGLIKTLRKVERIFGKVHVNFGEPIFLEQLLKAYGLDDVSLMYCDDPLPPAAKDVIDELAKLINQNINRAAVINPVSLLSLVLLSTPKHALDEDICIKQLDTYRKFADNDSYDENVAVTSLSGGEIIAYGIKLKLIRRVPHILGNIIQIEDNQAVLLTYFRNNIMHLFILSSFIASLVQHNGKISRNDVIHMITQLYPFLQAELFLKWRPEVIEDVITREIDNLVQAELIYDDHHGHLYTPTPNSEAFNQLSVMVAPIQQSLERYFITLTLISRQESGKINAKQIEDISCLLGQRLSMLHEFNSPDFFDRSLFRSFLTALDELDYLDIDSDNLIHFDERLIAIADDAKLVLSVEALKALEQVATLNNDEIDHAILSLETAKSKKQKKKDS